MFWQNNNETPGIADIMSINRYKHFCFLHLADNTCDPGNHKLYKVWCFATLLTTQFQSQYTLNQQVTIDKAIISFKSRLSFKQYMKTKPTKWGIKVFVLSDATNEYIHRQQIYIGKDINSETNTGLCSRVVLDLMSGMETDRLHLFTDDYYTVPVYSYI